MKIAILGVGAIGGYIAAQFSQLKDSELFLLARSNFHEIKSEGIILTKSGAKEPGVYKNFKVTDDVHNIPKCDVIIICVRSHQNFELLPGIAHLCHSETKMITLQNGLNFENEIANSLLENIVLYSGTCWIKISTLSKNHIRHDFGTLIKLGQYSGKPTNSEEVVELFQSVGLTVEITDNITAVQLTKLALNAPFFTISAMTGKSVVEILFDSTLDVKRNILQDEIIQASVSINAHVDVVFIEGIIRNLREMQPIPPKSREDLIERMKAELSQSAGALLKFFRNSGLMLPEFHQAYVHVLNSKNSTV